MFESAIVDLDGTVYTGDTALPGAVEGVETLREAGVDVRFFTNNASRSAERYATRLRRLGVPAEPDDVVSSGRITADYLRTNHPDARTYVVGEEPFVRLLRRTGSAVVEDPRRADVLVVALDRSFDYDRLTDALHALDGDTPFLATNPDRTRSEDGVEVPSTGGIVGAITGTTGREPDAVLGKPSEHAAAFVRDRFGFRPERTLMVGDRLDTDVVLGNAVGMTTAVVLTGVTDRADLRSVPPGAPTDPDHVLHSLAGVSALLDPGDAN